jgi:hypothetical protein
MNWYRKIAMPVPEADYSSRKNTGEEGYRNVDETLKDPKLLEEFGDLSYIGEGNIGMAFDKLNSGTVLKTTPNIKEYNIAMEIMEQQNLIGEPLEGIAQVISAKQVQENPDFFAIEMEKVEPLSGVEKEAVDLMSVIFPEMAMTYTPDDPRGLAAAQLELKKYVAAGHMSEEAHYWVSFMYYDYAKLWDDLIAMNFNPGDTHGGNVGKRGEELVVLDLGGLEESLY